MIEFLLNGEPIVEYQLDEPFKVGNTPMTVGEACVLASVLLYTQVSAAKETGIPLRPEDTWVAI